MLLQTNSYVVPREKRAEHARLVRKFRQTLARIGCDQFDVFEQVGANWGGGETTGRFVQMMRFRDRKQQLAVQAAERADPAAQALIAEFCELINFPYQQQQGLFAVGFYQSVLPVAPNRATEPPDDQSIEAAAADGEPGGFQSVDESAESPAEAHSAESTGTEDASSEDHLTEEQFAEDHLRDDAAGEDHIGGDPSDADHLGEDALGEVEADDAGRGTGGDEDEAANALRAIEDPSNEV
jgi:hypothetical protein